MKPIRIIRNKAFDPSWLFGCYVVEFTDDDEKFYNGFTYNKEKLQTLFKTRAKKVYSPQLDAAPIVQSDLNTIETLTQNDDTLYVAYGNCLYLLLQTSKHQHIYYQLADDVFEYYKCAKQTRNELQRYTLPYGNKDKEYLYSYHHNTILDSNYDYVLCVTEINFTTGDLGRTITYELDIPTEHKIEYIENFIQARSRDVIFDD